MVVTIANNDSANWTAQGAERIANNVANILKIRKGEVPFMRDLGISEDYIDAPIEENRGAIISDIAENIATYEPRAKVLQVDILGIDAAGEMSIKVVIEIE